MQSYIFSDNHKKRSKIDPKYFTRDRKLKLEDITAMIINMIRRTLQIEIDSFIENILNKKDLNYTKQAFSKARQKLSPKAFSSLNDELIKEYYSDNDFKKYEGWRLLAIDGSILEIPDNPETQIIYGYSENQVLGLKIARAKMSELYDIENELSISAKIDHYKSSEIRLAKENIEKLLSFGHDEVKNLIIFDRGYPSFDLIKFLNEKKIDFLMRLNTSYWQEEIKNAGEDEEIEIIINKNRKKELKRQGLEVKIGDSIKIRVIKFKLDSGQEEILITNLTKEKLTLDEAKKLYFKRWSIETRFDALKNRLEIENFSGEKPLIIEQDFYATQFVSNMAAILKHDAEEQLKKKNKEKNLKHEYKINNNILFGKIKNQLVLLLLEENEEKKLILYKDFIEQIQKNVIPVRKNRKFERKKKTRSNKSPKCKRRAI